MNHRVLAIVLALSLLLSGCSLAKKLVPKNNYHFSVDHDSQNEQVNEDTTISVANKEDLEETIRSLIKQDKETASISADDYDGNLKEDCDAIIGKLLHQVPETAYVVSSIVPDLKEADMFYKLNLTINYSTSYSDIANVKKRYVYSEEDMQAALKNALENGEEKVLLRVFHYETAPYEEGDYYNTQAMEFFASDPISIMALPKISGKAYPDTGNERIVALKFDYSSDPTADFELSQAELGVMKKTVARFIDSAIDYASYADNDKEKAFQIYSYLTGLHHYSVGDTPSETPAFDLLTKGIADSHILAIVYNAMCTQAGLTCHVVQGQKDESDYYWNILEFEDYACHVDILADELNNLPEPRLLFDPKMTDYTWNQSSYPECREPLPASIPDETASEDKPSTEPTTEPAEEPTEETSAENISSNEK